MVTRSFVAERTLDENEVWRIVSGHNPSCGGYAYEKLATGGEQLLRKEYSERRPNCASHDAEFLIISFEPIEVGVVAGPRLVFVCFAGGRQLAHDVSIRIEYTEFRNCAFREILLASGVLQQCFRREY